MGPSQWIAIVAVAIALSSLITTVSIYTHQRRRAVHWETNKDDLKELLAVISKIETILLKIQEKPMTQQELETSSLYPASDELRRLGSLVSPTVSTQIATLETAMILIRLGSIEEVPDWLIDALKRGEEGAEARLKALPMENARLGARQAVAAGTCLQLLPSIRSKVKDALGPR